MKTIANFNFNKVILGGRLTTDPELKTTASGVTVTSFTIAVSRRHTKGENAQTDFINCQAWRQQAELITRYFKKGSSICVVGSIQTRSWTDNNGTKRYATEVVIDEVSFVDSKSDNGSNPSGNSAGGQMPTQAQNAAFGYYQDAPTGLEEITDDDELPF